MTVKKNSTSAHILRLPLPFMTKWPRYWRLWNWQRARNPWFNRALWLTATLFILDQITKLWVQFFSGLELYETLALSALMDFTYVQNRGVSFGLFAGGLSARILLSLLAVGVVFFLLSWLASLRRAIPAIGVGLIIGGALGNTFDRVAYGYVIDFIDCSAIHYPGFTLSTEAPFVHFAFFPFYWVFNLADTGVNLGVACLAYDAFFGPRTRMLDKKI